MGAKFPGRGLLAKRASDGLWFHRVDRNETKSASTFRQEVAAQFGLPVSAIMVIEVTFTDAADQERVTAALAAGRYQGTDVVAPGVPAPTAGALARGRIQAAVNDPTLSPAARDAFRALLDLTR